VIYAQLHTKIKNDYKILAKPQGLLVSIQIFSNTSCITLYE